MAESKTASTEKKVEEASTAAKKSEQAKKREKTVSKVKVLKAKNISKRVLNMSKGAIQPGEVGLITAAEYSCHGSLFQLPGESEE